MNPVRERRLLSDLAAAEAACRASRQRIVLDEAVGDPPAAFHFRFRCVGVVGLEGDRAVYGEEHRVYVRFPPLYPAEPPTVQMLTPVVHPHVWPNGTMCLGTWRVTEKLDSLLQRIGDMLTYAPAALNWRSVADDRAAAWARQHQELFPLDQPLFTAVPVQMLAL